MLCLLAELLCTSVCVRQRLLIQLQKAEALAADDDLQPACSTCIQALDLSTAAGLNMQTQAPAAQESQATLKAIAKSAGISVTLVTCAHQC